jgi:hypothetical protein
MTLSDLASIGSFVSAIAVLISLIYLGLQVRQAERNQRAIVQQGRATRSADLLLHIADPGIISAYSRGYLGDPDMSDTEIDQYRVTVRASFYGFEDAFLQHNQKLMDDASFGSTVAAIRYFLSYPGSRAMWKQARTTFGASFMAFMDELISEVAVAPPIDLAARWRADVLAEKAAAAVAGQAALT